MKTRVVILLALALAGCKPEATSLSGARPPPRGAQVFATLAPLGSFEWHAAPLYTRNAALRHRAAVLLDDKRITVARAIAVQNGADRVRRLLDDAVEGEAVETLKAARDELDAAERLLGAAK